MTVIQIQNLVCLAYSVTRIDMLSKRRNRAIVLPRHVAIWLCRHCTLHSLPEIGRYFRKRDHTTVMNAIERIDARIAADSEFAFRITRLRRAVESGDSAEFRRSAMRAVA
jgi:chromosomal replication initiator protein